MAHFYASIKGSRGEATRMGTPSSGIHGHLRGWDIGARVSCYVDSETGTDRVSVYVTGGSNDRLIPVYVGSWRINKNGEIEKTD